MNQEYIVNLISQPLNSITFHNKYIWNKFKNVIIDLQKKIINSKNIKKFVEYYSFYLLIFNNYINYMNLINHVDINDENIYETINNFKYNSDVFSKIAKYKDNVIVQEIIKIINPFVVYKIKKSDNKDCIKNIKQYDDVINLENSYKKITNLIIYRYLFCKSEITNNYNEFYIKYYLDGYKINNLHNVILQIPKLIPIINKKNISYNELSFNKNNNNNNDIELNMLHHIINCFNINYNFNLKLIVHSNIYIIKNDVCKIFVAKSDIDEIIFLQHNVQNLNIPELKRYSLTKNGNNVILVKFTRINNYINILYFFYNIIISIKIMNKKNNSLLDLYTTNYIKYFYEIYSFYLLFISNYDEHIKNKCITSIIQHLIIYSHYDYYFYCNDNLLVTLNSNPKKKYKILNEFCNHINVISPKILNSLYSFPPFVDESELKEIYEYSFNIPSYFKLYYFVLAIKDIYKFNSLNIKEIYNSFISNTYNNANNNTNNNNNNNTNNNNTNNNNTNNNTNNNANKKNNKKININEMYEELYDNNVNDAFDTMK